jgi:hypothetical protein
MTMAYEQRDNSGQLFRNDKREKETHANAKGKAMVGGVMYWVSAWTKKDKNGNPWQSLAFDPVEKQPAAADPIKDAAVKDMGGEVVEDIPF